MNCADIKAQLVDFLYDELPVEVRGPFAEHVHSCPSCSSALAGFQKTLGQSRAALTGLLAEEPPARTRLVVLEAARKAVESAPAVRTVRDDEPGFFARLFRIPWLLPAFSAAGIATAVFLVRVLKNPEIIPEQRQETVETAKAPTPTAPSMPRPAAEETKPWSRSDNGWHDFAARKDLENRFPPCHRQNRNRLPRKKTPRRRLLRGLICLIWHGEAARERRARRTDPSTTGWARNEKPLPACQDRGMIPTRGTCCRTHTKSQLHRRSGTKYRHLRPSLRRRPPRTMLRRQRQPLDVDSRRHLPDGQLQPHPRSQLNLCHHPR
jgi:hypothetical protein